MSRTAYLGDGFILLGALGAGVILGANTAAGGRLADTFTTVDRLLSLLF